MWSRSIELIKPQQMLLNLPWGSDTMYPVITCAKAEAVQLVDAILDDLCRCKTADNFRCRLEALWPGSAPPVSDLRSFKTAQGEAASGAVHLKAKVMALDLRLRPSLHAAFNKIHRTPHLQLLAGELFFSNGEHCKWTRHGVVAPRQV